MTGCLADTVLRVPLEEFSHGIQRAPKLIQPLSVKETGTRIVLSVSQGCGAPRCLRRW